MLPGVPVQCDEWPSRPCLRRRTSAARARSRFDIAPAEEDPFDGDHDWRLTALVDLAECDREGRAVVHLLSVGPQQG